LLLRRDAVNLKFGSLSLLPKKMGSLNGIAVMQVKTLIDSSSSSTIG
jgi:hypothetical protein